MSKTDELKKLSEKLVGSAPDTRKASSVVEYIADQMSGDSENTDTISQSIAYLTKHVQGGGGGDSQELTDFLNSIILMDCDEITPTTDVQTEEYEEGGQWYRWTSTTTTYTKTYANPQAMIEAGKEGILYLVNSNQLLGQRLFYYKKDNKLKCFGMSSDSMTTSGNYTIFTHSIGVVGINDEDNMPISDTPEGCTIVYKELDEYSIRLVWVEGTIEPIPAPSN